MKTLPRQLYDTFGRRGRSWRAIAKLVAMPSIRLLSRARLRLPVEQARPEYVMWLEMLLGQYERHTARACRQLLRPGMIVADVGAHVGYFSLLFADCVGESGHVYAFEPHPYNRCLLQLNTARRTNITVVGKAVADRSAEVPFFASSIGSGSHSLREDRVAAHARAVVHAITLDEFFDGMRLDFVKIDVEGAEELVLAGAERLLNSAKPPALLLEVCPQLATASGGEVPSLTLLRHKGYCLTIIDDTAGRVEPLDTPDGIVAALQAVKKYANVLAVRR